jgi:hypothetical protein
MSSLLVPTYRLVRLLTSSFHFGEIGVISLVLLGGATASAQTFSVIHTFTGGVDGSEPLAGISMDSAGNLYGASQQEFTNSLTGTARGSSALCITSAV